MLSLAFIASPSRTAFPGAALLMIFWLWSSFCAALGYFFRTLEAWGVFSNEFCYTATLWLVPLLILWRVFGPAYQGAGIRYQDGAGWRDTRAEDLAKDPSRPLEEAGWAEEKNKDQ